MSDDPSLAEKVVSISRALRRLPHAFGGALALAYYAEPRATIDIDLNVFVGVERFDDVARRLTDVGVSDASSGEARERALADGQARVFWGRTPIDVFFSYDRFHRAAAAARRRVPFGDISIAILAPEHLVVAKAVFDRTKDWVDIEAMLTMGTAIDTAEVLRWVGRTVGDSDARYTRLAALLTHQAG